MGKQQKLMGCLLLSTLIGACHGFCYTSEHAAVSPRNGLKFETDEFDLNEIVGSLFSLMELLGKEVLSPLGKGYYRAQKEDLTCVWLSHKTPFSQILDTSMNYTLQDIPLVTDIRQLDSNLFLVHHGGRADYMSETCNFVPDNP